MNKYVWVLILIYAGFLTVGFLALRDEATKKQSDVWPGWIAVIMIYGASASAYCIYLISIKAI
jgi:hypothetical protein